MVTITINSNRINKRGPQPDKPPFVDNYCYLTFIQPEDERCDPHWVVTTKHDSLKVRELVFTCETCWELTSTYNGYPIDNPLYLTRCSSCNSKFLRWKWRKKFQERIPLRPQDRQWLATFTWGQPMVNATAQERMIILEAMKIAMQKLTKTKLWKDTFTGYVWVYEEAMHDESTITKTTDLFGNVISEDVNMRFTHHPHIHAVLEKKDNSRFTTEEFEKVKNHIRKYFSQYVWLKPIKGGNATAKAINYTLKYVSKDIGIDAFGNSSRKVFIGGTWREKPPKR